MHSFVLGEGQEIRCTISLGAAQYHKGLTFKDVIKKADDNLYKAKNNGRNLLVVS